jgi:hypothetical protein
MQVQLTSDTQSQQQDKQQHNKKQQQRWWQQQSSKQQQQHPEVLDLLLNGKPLMCLAFSDMVVSESLLQHWPIRSVGTYSTCKQQVF